MGQQLHVTNVNNEVHLIGTMKIKRFVVETISMSNANYAVQTPNERKCTRILAIDKNPKPTQIQTQ